MGKLNIEKDGDGYIPAVKIKVGRPRRGRQLASKTLAVCLTEDEYDEAGRLSGRLGISMSALMRRCFLEHKGMLKCS